MEVITSLNNQFIKNLYKLKNKKYRDQEKRFLVEGEHLVLEAYKTNNLEAVLITDENYKLDGVRNIFVTDNIIEKLAFTKTPQKLIGVSKFISFKHNDPKRYLIVDDIQDPGNLGTIIRTCLGFNIDKIYLSKNSVDIYNDKLIRATQGSIFHMDIEIVEIQEKIIELKSKGIKVYGTSLEGGVELESISTTLEYALILGNEGSGIRQEILELTDKNIYIKTNPKLESLNVAIAGSIILYMFNKNNPEI